MAQPVERESSEVVGLTSRLQTSLKLAEASFDNKLVQTLVSDSRRLFDVLAVLYGNTPAEGSKNRSIYDGAISAYGDLDKAKSTLERMHIASLIKISGLLDKFPEDERKPFAEMLSKIESGVNRGDERYLAYEAQLSLVTRLLDGVNKKSSAASGSLTEEDVVAGKENLQIITPKLTDLGPVTLVSKSNTEAVHVLGANPSPTQKSMFGGEANARNAIAQLASAYNTLFSKPNDAAAQKAAASALYAAFNNVPQNKEVWKHDSFKQAMDKLKNGDLKGGLELLSKDPSFNSLYQSLNQVYTVLVSQRAIAVMRAGTSVRYEFDDNMQSFNEFLRSGTDDRFFPRLLYAGVGLYWEYLNMSGELQQLQITKTQTSVVSRQQLTGTGQTVGATGQLAAGTSVWNQPLEVVLHCSAGYREWEMGKDVKMLDGTTQKISVGDKGAFLGIWGVEVRSPGREGDKARIRVENAGLANVGLTNPLAYVTVSGNWFEGNSVRIHSYVTPTASYFLQQFRTGAELKPVDITVKGKRGSLVVSPSVSYERNLGTDVNTWRGALNLGYRFTSGAAIELNAGVLGETGGAEGSRLPVTPYGGLNLSLPFSNPKEWFKPTSTGKITAVPKKRDE